MGFQLVAYETLKKNINDGIIAVIGKHKFDTSNIEKSILELDPDRRIHCQLLRKYIALLDASKLADIDKIRVLNGAVYYIRSQIEASYPRTSPTNSMLYVQLTASLGLQKDNTPNTADLEFMYLTLSKFIHGQIFIEGKVSKGYIKNHPFSTIEGYSVLADLKALVKTLLKLKIDSLEEVEKKEAAEAKPKGLLGGFFGTVVSKGGASGGSASFTPVAELK